MKSELQFSLSQGCAPATIAEILFTRSSKFTPYRRLDTSELLLDPHKLIELFNTFTTASAVSLEAAGIHG